MSEADKDTLLNGLTKSWTSACHQHTLRPEQYYVDDVDHGRLGHSDTESVKQVMYAHRLDVISGNLLWPHVFFH